MSVTKRWFEQLREADITDESEDYIDDAYHYESWLREKQTTEFEYENYED